MPCSKYKSKKQRGLCYLTDEWKDFSKIKKVKKKKKSATRRKKR